MRGPDDWAMDPSVRSTRELFRLMEEGQRRLLVRAAISPFDQRLRGWRAQAFRVFEGVWQDTARKGEPWSAEEASAAYVAGFSRILSSAGVRAPSGEGTP